MIKDEIKAILREKGYDGKIDHPSIEKFGDFSVRGDVDLNSDNELIEKIEKVAGFTNIFIKKEKLIEEASEIGGDNWRNEIEEIGKGKTMVIDYSAPNIAKPFGIGHLRSTNIGQALYNIYQILGWRCIGDNHLGDWGTQFGKMMSAYKNWGDKKLEEMSIADLEKLYVKFHEEAEKNKALEKEGQEWFAKLEYGDMEAREMWQKCIEISLKEFNRVYEMIGVKIDYAYGESFYEPMLKDIVREIKDKGITKESEGTTIVEFKDLAPAILMKSDGATIYFTRDMATIKYRVKTWNPDLIIYEVGAEQSLYFKQLFEAAEMMGWINKNKLVHIAHGLIRWKDGKFSTRKGQTIHLEEVIEKAMEAVSYTHLTLPTN
jgi:arginyl-tRNA synthetase